MGIQNYGDRLIGSHPGFVAGNWHALIMATVAAGVAPGANSIRAMPFWLPKAARFSDLATRVNTVDAAGNFQLAIYGFDPATHLPAGPALAKTGDMSTAAAAVVTQDIVGADVSLMASLYWACLNTNSATAVFQAWANIEPISNFLIGYSNPAYMAPSSAGGGHVRFAAQAYGTWPDASTLDWSGLPATNGSHATLYAKAS